MAIVSTSSTSFTDHNKLPSSTFSSSSVPTERECIQKLNYNITYYDENFDHNFSLLEEAFKECSGRANLSTLTKKTKLDPYYIYWILDIWERNPNTYFQNGRISKLYSVATTKDLWGREHFQTYNTLPYYESVTKKNIQTKKPEPIWVYFNKNHPLARSHDMTHFLNGHPFVQELLLNGAVCEDIYE